MVTDCGRNPTSLQIVYPYNTALYIIHRSLANLECSTAPVSIKMHQERPGEQRV
jgi:hypothetical protein